MQRITILTPSTHLTRKGAQIATDAIATDATTGERNRHSPAQFFAAQSLYIAPILAMFIAG